MSNATIATCKTNAVVHKDTVKTKFIYDPVIRTSEKMKPSEHQVTHEIEGNPGPSGPLHSKPVVAAAQLERTKQWVELPDCEGKKDEVPLTWNVSNATWATCKPKAKEDAKKPAAGDAKAAAKPAAGDAKAAAKPAAGDAKAAADKAAADKAAADKAAADKAAADKAAADKAAADKAAADKAAADKAAADKAAAAKKA